MRKRIPVITVDGPSGSGKGTVSQRLARDLGWHFLDSGALYRLTALSVQSRGIDPVDADDVAVLASHLDIRFDAEGGLVYLEGDDVTKRLRSERTGEIASRVAAHNEVRKALLDRQRNFRRAPGLVADGRDMGTVVFPDADAKIFLTASAEERARRRYRQLAEAGLDEAYEDILRDVVARDERDQSRAVSPLVPAEDAVRLDSTHLTIDEVSESIHRLLVEKGLVGF